MDPRVALSDADLLETCRAFLQRLRSTGYTAQGLSTALHAAGETSASAGQVLALTAPRLATLVDLLQSSRSVSHRALVAVFGGSKLQHLVRFGLLRDAEAGMLRSAVHVTPWQRLLLLSDDHTQGVVSNPVHTPESSSTALARQLPLVRGSRLLDVGCGAGFFGLAAASHGVSAVGIDRNPRAVWMARLNAVLNGVQGVRVLPGSLYAPLSNGERFDLIVGNLPFIPSLRETLPSYHGGPLGDRYLAGLLDGLSQHLDDDGSAHFAVSGYYGGHPDQLVRLRALLGDRRSHVILLQMPEDPVRRTLAEAYGYAAMREGRGAAGKRAEFERHLRHLQSRGVTAFGAGYLHIRGTRGRPVTWAISASGPDGLSDRLVTSFFALAEKVSKPGWRDELTRARLTTTRGLELHHIVRTSAAPRWEVRFADGDARRSASVTEGVAALLRAAKGRRSLEAIAGGHLGRAGQHLALEMVKRGWLSAEGWTVPW